MRGFCRQYGRCRSGLSFDWIMALVVVEVVGGGEGKDLVVGGCGLVVIWVSVGGGEELYGSGLLKGLAKMALSTSL